MPVKPPKAPCVQPTYTPNSEGINHVRRGRARLTPVEVGGKMSIALRYPFWTLACAVHGMNWLDELGLASSAFLTRELFV